jgi:hypothetical protein
MGEAVMGEEDMARTQRTSTEQGLPAFYGLPEANPFLQKQKVVVLKKLNFQCRSVFCQRDLAICLVALGRDEEAVRVLEYAHRNVRFRGKYDVWYAAVSACSIAAYLRRKQGESQQADLELQRFIDQPAHAILTQPQVWTAAFVRKHIAGERKRFEQWFNDPDPGKAVEAMAWWAATVIFFREMTFAGLPRKGKLNVARLDSRIDDALAQLRNRLDREANPT